MNTTRHLPVLIRQLIISVAMVSIILLAPAWALAAAGVAVAAPPGTAQPSPGTHGAPIQVELVGYAGSQNHYGVEQQLYGPSAAVAPRVDTTVHQSR